MQASATPTRSIGMIGIGLMGHGHRQQPAQAWASAGRARPSWQPAVGRPEGQRRHLVHARVADLSGGQRGGDPVSPAHRRWRRCCWAIRRGGVIAALRARHCVIDCSTAIPASTERMAQAVQAAGGRFLDAPMTRTPGEAALGKLNLLVGGDTATFEEMRPLLACFAENIFHAGRWAPGNV